MENRVKTIRDFCSVRSIDEVIDSWAKKSAFKESILSAQVSSNDIVYWFSLDDGNAKTQLTINILDDKVHLETWVQENIKDKLIQKNDINSLLKMLGQEPI